MNTLVVMLVMRALYLGLILWHADPRVAALNVPVFLVTLPLAWYGRKHQGLYALDAYLMAVFSGALLVGFFPALLGTYGGPLGADKFFHALGGFGAAWIAWLLYRNGIADRRVLLLSVVLGAIAIGALWEVFEWLLWILPEPFRVANDGYADTNMDLVADTLGALVFVAVKAFKRPRS